jgi:DNA-binding MarR family transcriptional regulator
MVTLTRAFGWHRPGETPCGKAVPIAEAHALLELSKETGLNQQELSGRLNLRKSTVSRLVSNLDRRGWITRSRNAHDRRAFDLSLTKAGEGAAAELAIVRNEKMTAVLSKIPESERDGVLHALTTLIEAIHETDP